MKPFYRFLTLIVLCSYMVLPAAAQKNPDLAKTPPMGWNSWNWFGKAEINEQVCVESIDAIVSSGLKDAGYVYFIVDGGWRDGLNDKGEIVVNKEKFPRGMKFLSDYAHSKGLKFGLHTVPGKYDCGGDRVGGYGNEDAQLKQFVDWELDFIKLDKCSFDRDENGKVIPWNQQEERELYQKWSKMIAECPRDIVFNISAYRLLDWHPQWSNMSRTTGDIMCRSGQGTSFERSDLGGKKRARNTIMEIADRNEPLWASAGNGYWNDMDMLSTGDQGLTPQEQQAHFALWCIMSSPLFLGNDPRNMTVEELATVSNKDAIAVNQDTTEQGRRVWKDGDLEIWKKNLSGGKYALLLLNRSKNPGELKADFVSLGMNGKFKVKDIFGKKQLGKSAGISHRFDSRGCVFLLLE